MLIKLAVISAIQKGELSYLQFEKYVSRQHDQNGMHRVQEGELFFPQE